MRVVALLLAVTALPFAGTAPSDDPAIPVVASAMASPSTTADDALSLQSEAPAGWSPPPCLPSSGSSPSDSQDLLVTPASQFSLEVLGPAKDVRLVIALCSGTSLGATLDVPPGCRGGGTMSVHVIGFSNGQKVAEVRCPDLPEGEHGFLVESKAATFSGEARLYGAVFG